MPMSWTTISTSTSSSTFYQTNVDGPANALGIEVLANAAATPQRPLQPHRLPQVDVQSARVTSALHTGMYVLLHILFASSPSSMCTHTVGVAMAASCTVLVLCVLRGNHLLLRHSPMFITCPPSQKHIPVRLLRAQPPADARQTRNDKRKNKAPCSSASGILFSLKKLALVA